MSRLTGLGIVVRSLPQRPDTPTNPGIRGGISAGEREAGNRQRGLISRTYNSLDPIVIIETTAIVITETQKAERRHQRVKGALLPGCSNHVGGTLLKSNANLSEGGSIKAGQFELRPREKRANVNKRTDYDQI
ncbi:hypothetical protein ALC56_10490 [Trachymyrmex septentrionalis]|uniref:Uncharacterized protein n=1 Tax=Trachymyrmex septentrionalis TaxID=34720 RepID=A0A195F409_9HYME|nr:hypothetical protein ALC56_10490 [Trachymyrmex septentrionalis]